MRRFDNSQVLGKPLTRQSLLELSGLSRRSDSWSFSKRQFGDRGFRGCCLELLVSLLLKGIRQVD